jgi:hypothetical protein
MLIKNAADIAYSEVTPKDVWLGHMGNGVTLPSSRELNQA